MGSKVIVHCERIRKLQRPDLKKIFNLKTYLEARLVVSENLRDQYLCRNVYFITVCKVEIGLS